MTKTKSTKRALLMSFLSILLCVSMLIGTTYAWFTDEVTSGNNIIKAGNLDVAMNWKDATATGAQQEYKDASEGPIFDYDLWEPGYVEAKNVEIKNVGTLAFKYQLRIEAEEEVSILANVIDVYYAEAEYKLNDRTMPELTRVGTLAQVLEAMPDNMTGALKAGEADQVTIALKMQEEAGNEYKSLSIGSKFTVKLFATQDTVEFDSFDDQYDADAAFPIVTVNATTWDEVAALAAAGKHIVLKNDISGEAMIELNGGSIDGAGYTMTYTGTGRGKVVIDPTGGTIKNVKIVAPNANMFDNQWAIGSMQQVDTTLTDDLYLENVEISGFQIALDMKAEGHSIKVKDSEIANWMQVNGAKEFSFENCHFLADGAAQLTFNQPTSKQAILFLMGDMSFTNCHFEEDVNFYLDSARFSGTVRFDNSTYGNNGVENRPIDSFGFIKYWFPATGVYGYAGTFGDTKPAQTHFNWYVNGELVWDATAI